MQQQGSGGGTASSTTTSGGRRRVLVRGAAAAATAPAGSGSVWEARMRMDEVKGGVKVFSAGGGDEPADEEGMRVYRRLRRNQSDGNAGAGNGAAAAAKKRRNWKASEPVTAIGDLRKSHSDAMAAVSTTTTTTTAVVARRAVARVTTPEKKIAPVAAAGGEVKEVVVVDVHKAQAEEEPEEELDDDAYGLDDEELEAEEEEKEMLDQDHMAVDKDETALHQVDDDGNKDLEPPTKAGIKSTLSVEDERAANPEPVKPPPEKKLASAIDLRAINPEPMTPPPGEKKTTSIIVHRMTNFEPAKTSPEKKALLATGGRIPKHDPVSNPPKYEEIQGRPSQPSRSHERMQNIVNLVMWRDVSKSALVFGLGTFLLISSSYVKDLNFNTITAASYAGLIYLGLRFLRKSILNRGETVDCEDERDSERCYLVGEEEAIWLLRLVLPYINEVLLNLRSLFSGEPATTMKLALLLFAMARCGNFVTLWTLAKLVFFGVFIIPKVCSSYSTQLARYGKFWLDRFRDAWESCSHKKAVVAAVFTLVWNVSSTVARVWAVFMLVVAMKLYQHRMVEFGWSSTVEEGGAAADEAEADDEVHSEEQAAKPSLSRAQGEAQVFGTAAVPRHRRAPVSGEFAKERLRARGGIQPR
ncbi:reticulon-like protein B21 isoform X3 [Panicum virgatum]|uniref:reticulon-like protein B21 isoform X3 n=1 Tax=Panicum virgatum TaxID=38727 RepID=UPI0019D63CFF|nr:reticulon-like protein B21 isoform X3 [Panicum virgatum]